ncbi:hypothetical protein RBWH47_00989 [Rhodopirellula baltica WH47]|uniref:Uncharacterized protein n=1 Tax=Rhodopirellula baltica WH47 TaxID=991778 RepID=F2AYL6_RHOBT|nr:hypothetical protein RBWH47_00989 [Rhodopirellula baltica WH47]
MPAFYDAFALFLPADGLPGPSSETKRSYDGLPRPSEVTRGFWVGRVRA